jgi:hypothetical protein
MEIRKIFIPIGGFSPQKLLNWKEGMFDFPEGQEG